MTLPTTTTESKPRFCSACGAPLAPGAAFCHRCGAAVGAGRAAPSAANASFLIWGVASLAVVALLAFVGGQMFGRRDANRATADGGPGIPTMQAPDISSMSPQERADRLFKRVMQYVSAGKLDSAQFFAPMAIGAFEAIQPPTAHTRYDLGLVALMTGDQAIAAAQADSILRASPTHLLGLMLAEGVAETRGDTVAVRALNKRLVAADQSERAKALPEYTEHASDIRSALAAAHAAGK